MKLRRIAIPALAFLIGFALAFVLVINYRGTSERVWRAITEDHP